MDSERTERMNPPEAEIGRPEHPGWRRRLAAYAKLVRLDRPIGIFLLLWPALWALWIAGAGNPPWWVVLVFVAGVVLMRSAGCAINDFADRDFDGQVERTRQRPIPAGLVTPREAVAVFLVLCLIAFFLVLTLGWPTVGLSVVALGLAAIYPFMKRYTHLPQVFLGAAFGWAVPMAFMAVTGSVPASAWILFAAAIVWALVYDTQYAMVDRKDDLAAGIKSSAILFGRHDRLLVGLLQILLLLLLATAGALAGRGAWYGGGLLVAAALAGYQQYLMRGREPASCFAAFMNNHYLGMAVFVGLAADYTLG